MYLQSPHTIGPNTQMDGNHWALTIEPQCGPCWGWFAFYFYYISKSRVLNQHSWMQNFVKQFWNVNWMAGDFLKINCIAQLKKKHLKWQEENVNCVSHRYHHKNISGLDLLIQLIYQTLQAWFRSTHGKLLGVLKTVTPRRLSTLVHEQFLIVCKFFWLFSVICGFRYVPHSSLMLI